MGIQKFIVNGDEAKIDYEGLENKPFGNITEETIYPLKTSTYVMQESQARVMLDFSDFTKALVAGEHYTVNFDGTIYEVDAVVNGSAVAICNVPLDDSESGLPSGGVFIVATMVQATSGMAMAIAQTAGEHSLFIKQTNISTLDPMYLPKDLQFVRENSKLIMDTTPILFEAL